MASGYPALDIEPINPVNAFLQGRQAAINQQGDQTTNALRQAALVQTQRANALYGNPNATPEDFIRNGDVAAGQALQQTAVSQQTAKQQAVQQLGSIAQRALTLDPQSRRQFLQSAAQVYAPAFTAMGADPQKGVAELESLPDDQLEQRLQQVAKFAPQNFVKMGPGEQIVDQNNPTAPAVASVPGKVEYKDTGDQLVPTDAATGAVRKDLPPIKKTLTPDQQAKESGGLSDAAKDFAVERLLSGEDPRKILGNLGRGNQGAKDLRDIQNRLADTAAKRGIPASTMVQIMQNTASEGRAVLELGAREGKIAPRVQEAQNFAQMALQASQNVPRGNWTDMTKFLQWGAQHTSDPNFGRFQIANNSLINAYAAAIGGGVVHVEDQKHGHELLSTASGPEDYAARVDQLIKETQGALDAPAQVRARITGQPQPSSPVPAPSSPAAASVPTATGANGQKLYLRNGQWVPQ